MSKRDTRLLIEDIIDSIGKIEKYTKDLTKDQFQRDEKTVDAVIRNFEIIGEAASQISEPDKLQYSQIEWRKIIGLRNRIVHDYFGIDLDIIWEIKETFLQHLLEKLRALNL
jgi:uncharacterized protein with HEPN domain